MGWVRYITLFLSLFLLASVSFADVVVQSGDNGAQFVNQTAASQCQQPNVQAVYKCLGNVVRVVSAVSGQGSTFYKPDGSVIHCPVVAPSQMGAECLQMMTPNYCPDQAQCGASPTPQVFPGQNNTAEQTGNVNYYIVPGQAANDNITNQSNSTTPVSVPTQQVMVAPPVKANNLELPTSAKSNLDSPLNYLVYVVVALGIGSIAVLFFMFKNSISEEETS